MFILDRIDRSLTPLSQTFRAEIWLKFSEFFHNIPLRILLDVLFRVVRFSKASFYAPTSFLQLRRHLETETYGRFGNLVISHVKLQINAEISRQN